jgi:hypothetical protein
MNQLAMVKGHLAGFQHDVHGTGGTHHRIGYLLIHTQEVLL